MTDRWAIALAELGCGRVAHPYDVWIDLLSRQWLTPEEFRRLCEKSKAHLKDLSPRIPDRVNRYFP